MTKSKRLQRTELDRMPHRRTTTVLVGAIVCLAAFVLYVRTLAPGVLYYDRPLLMDSAMLQVHVYTLGITHPTGYPSYLMLTHLFTYLPFGDVAYRVNLASAVYGAGAVVLVYVAGLMLSRRVFAAAIGALAVAAGSTFWSMAVVAEVYTLNAVLILVPVVSLLFWRETNRDRYLLLAAFLVGLALTNHLTSGLVIPAGLLFVALVDRRALLRWRLILKGAGLFLLGLVPYVYLPVRGFADLPMRENDPSSFGRFYEMVSGTQLTNAYFGLNPVDLPGRLAFYGSQLVAEFGWGLLALAVVGAVVTSRRDRTVAALTGALYLGWLIHALGYGIYDVHLYFIPTYLMVGFWISIGADFLLRVVENATLSGGRKRAALTMIGAVFLFLPILGAAINYAEVDRSRDEKGRRTIEAVAGNVERGATVLHNRSSLWYMVVVEGRRTDLTLLDPFRPVGITTRDLSWPEELSAGDSAARYATHDPTGVEAAREAAKNGPVYLLDQESVLIEDFRDAGFQIRNVEKGVLYEVIPPGRS